jgi:hypothetical protein
MPKINRRLTFKMGKDITNTDQPVNIRHAHPLDLSGLLLQLLFYGSLVGWAVCAAARH